MCVKPKVVNGCSHSQSPFCFSSLKIQINYKIDEKTVEKNVKICKNIKSERKEGKYGKYENSNKNKNKSKNNN